MVKVVFDFTLPKTVFVTSMTYTGNLGGLSGADTLCAARASAAGLSGTYLAWLSMGSSSPATRFTQSSGPYGRTDGKEVAADWTALISGSLENAIDVDEFGNAVSTSTLPYVWTNTKAIGGETLATDSPSTCANFASASGANTGKVGAASADDTNWSATGAFVCSVDLHLYCFEQ